MCCLRHAEHPARNRTSLAGLEQNLLFFGPPHIKSNSIDQYQGSSLSIDQYQGSSLTEFVIMDYRYSLSDGEIEKGKKSTTSFCRGVLGTIEE